MTDELISTDRPVVLVVDPEEPCILTEEPSVSIEVDPEEPLVLADEPPPIVIEAGTQGPPGVDGSLDPIEVVSFESVTFGMPVYIRLTNGKASPARASDVLTSRVLGFAMGSVGPDATLLVTRDRVTLSDWSAIAGAVALTPGLTYFLSADAAGRIVTVPPSTAGQVVCTVGEAISPTTLVVQIGIPFLL